MDKVNAKMVIMAKTEFDDYCKQHGNTGKVQVALENAWLELENAYNLRKEDIRQKYIELDVVKFPDSDNFMSFPAFHMLYNEVWKKIADIVIAFEDKDEKGLDKAIREVGNEKRIKLGKLIRLLA